MSLLLLLFTLLPLSEVSASPKVGLYVRNYAGKVVQVVGESETGEDSSLSLTLPPLKVDEHIWEGKSITLDCSWGVGPLLWEYRGEGKPQVQVTTARTLEIPGSLTSPPIYSATVTFPFSGWEQTGEYTCRPLDLEKEGGQEVIHPSLYIFGGGGVKERIFLKDEEVTVEAEEGSSHVNLPCQTGNPDARVTLLKEQGQGSTTLATATTAAEFDPSTGFRLKWRGRGAVKGPWGWYTCRGSLGGKEESLRVQVLPPNRDKYSLISSADTEAQWKGGEVKLAYNSERRRIECCSSSPPQLRFAACTSAADCHFLAPQFLKEAEASKGLKEEPEYVVRLNETCSVYNFPAEIRESGLVACTAQGVTQHLQFSYDPRMSPPFLSTSSKGQTPPPRPRIGREGAFFYCHPHPFFFSQGLKWGFERSGSGRKGVELVPEQDGRTNIRPGKEELKGVERVWCFAPLWNSSQWGNVSLPTNS